MVNKVVERIRDHADVWKIILTVFVVVVLVGSLFLGEQAYFQSQINSRDKTISGLNAQVSRGGVAYAGLRDQDFTLGIIPSEGTWSQVLNPNIKTPGSPTPKSFTADFQGAGYFTCTDHSGAGNYVCVFTAKPPPTATTTTVPKATSP